MFLNLIKGLEKNEAKEDVISINIQKLLADKTYEKRKKGAQEIAEVVKLLLLKEKEDEQVQVDHILNECNQDGGASGEYNNFAHKDINTFQGFNSQTEVDVVNSEHYFRDYTDQGKRTDEVSVEHEKRTDEVNVEQDNNHREKKKSGEVEKMSSMLKEPSEEKLLLGSEIIKKLLLEKYQENFHIDLAIGKSTGLLQGKHERGMSTITPAEMNQMEKKKKKKMNKLGISNRLSELSQVNKILYEHDADIENVTNKYQNKKVISIINFLEEKFVQSIHPAERCGGLIALAFISITVDTQIKFYFSAILKLIISCVSDPDPKVRYYVCESLYNLCKVSKSVVFYYIEDIFDCLFRIFSDTCPNVKSGGAFLDNLLKDLTCSYNNVFNIYKIIFILKERIGIENSNARQVILSWLLLFQNIKTVNLFEYFHFFISDLFLMLADQNRDIQKQANQCLDLYVDKIITSNYEQVRSFFKHIAFIFIDFCIHKNTIIKHKCLLWLYHFIQILNVHFYAIYRNAKKNNLFICELIKRIIACTAHLHFDIHYTARKCSELLISFIKFSEMKCAPLLTKLICSIICNTISKVELSAKNEISQTGETRHSVEAHPASEGNSSREINRRRSKPIHVSRRGKRVTDHTPQRRSQQESDHTVGGRSEPGKDSSRQRRSLNCESKENEAGEDNMPERTDKTDYPDDPDSANEAYLLEGAHGGAGSDDFSFESYNLFYQEGDTSDEEGSKEGARADTSPNGIDGEGVQANEQEGDQQKEKEKGGEEGEVPPRCNNYNSKFLQKHERLMSELRMKKIPLRDPLKTEAYYIKKLAKRVSHHGNVSEGEITGAERGVSRDSVQGARADAERETQLSGGANGKGASNRRADPSSDMEEDIFQDSLDKRSIYPVIICLQWLIEMLMYKNEVIKKHYDEIITCVFKCLRNNDKQVVLLSLTVLSAMCSTVDNKFHFYQQVSSNLIALFRNDENLLIHKGKTIVQHLSRCLNNKKFFAYLSYSLINEEKIPFVTKFIQVLCWVLLTSEETKYLRNALFLKKQYSLFSLILISWLRNPISAISFLLWLQKYKLAYLICSYLSLLNLNSDIFHQLDNLIFLLESPIFSKQRIHLAYPQNYPFLIKSLMILSLMLPLNTSNNILQKRLQMSQLSILTNGQKVSSFVDAHNHNGLLHGEEISSMKRNKGGEEDKKGEMDEALLNVAQDLQSSQTDHVMELLKMEDEEEKKEYSLIELTKEERAKEEATWNDKYNYLLSAVRKKLITQGLPDQDTDECTEFVNIFKTVLRSSHIVKYYV
ncbi:conserved Plasmodium protein, unknown function [Plasmodium knowlesi strain H]|uniref:Vacuolar protein 14 C-terminal Fig4-binding domain-containing protein n=3 Tax=Plasmodium knowlesi TaxID=5850 RepID=A0A5K1V3M8_PLAKH|nr:VAC14 domain-containing protein, putative [Plasmodium knowlesi strain H]OTN64102.1 Uncharacterized protein PKNOH_S140263100 [Plasmodium knowlesi]CAA9991046.1 VAC14 domain-containing protein, putative [Plasmodium knowlesi strain H]SBO20669.1 conserved Plasmodium protein, unknown function [Plasmodium knowlesi strain H]SBO21097.1 conserved Plasmodium protein, unknown function [Plasmodium knowlesi strain H]VVS80520.1 VAC14 domain-containing protein, putative [Plasmodium knowlesi strain H]|eukprot:XP_002262328.1 hypothetical protein, conserved in Plasmodium species [Plasmodium knowlesi strain H]